MRIRMRARPTQQRRSDFAKSKVGHASESQKDAFLLSLHSRPFRYSSCRCVNSLTMQAGRDSPVAFLLSLCIFAS
ncbi:uncharacterized protein BDV17DRAFT_248259 [Aspergillus undulatus]|uniref:uncharacterized protein n=1 Tax=Aspergillus undulatus TaxID=1810928 RepID=UPI003CCE05B5